VYVRVTHLQYDPAQTRQEDFEAAAEPVVDAIAALPGFVSYQGGLDQETGAAIAISTWQDKEAAAFDREALGDSMRNLISVGVRFEEPAIYEVTITR
jgi:quinol monooxygenase YgiN